MRPQKERKKKDASEDRREIAREFVLINERKTRCVNIFDLYYRCRRRIIDRLFGEKLDPPTLFLARALLPFEKIYPDAHRRVQIHSNQFSSAQRSERLIQSG